MEESRVQAAAVCGNGRLVKAAVGATETPPVRVPYPVHDKSQQQKQQKFQGKTASTRRRQFICTANLYVCRNARLPTHAAAVENAIMKVVTASKSAPIDRHATEGPGATSTPSGCCSR